MVLRWWSKVWITVFFSTLFSVCAALASDSHYTEYSAAIGEHIFDVGLTTKVTKTRISPQVSRYDLRPQASIADFGDIRSALQFKQAASVSVLRNELNQGISVAGATIPLFKAVGAALAGRPNVMVGDTWQQNFTISQSSNLVQVAFESRFGAGGHIVVDFKSTNIVDLLSVKRASFFGRLVLDKDGKEALFSASRLRGDILTKVGAWQPFEVFRKTVARNVLRFPSWDLDFQASKTSRRAGILLASASKRRSLLADFSDVTLLAEELDILTATIAEGRTNPVAPVLLSVFYGVKKTGSVVKTAAGDLSKRMAPVVDGAKRLMGEAKDGAIDATKSVGRFVKQHSTIITVGGALVTGVVAAIAAPAVATTAAIVACSAIALDSAATLAWNASIVASREAIDLVTGKKSICDTQPIGMFFEAVSDNEPGFIDLTDPSDFETTDLLTNGVFGNIARITGDRIGGELAGSGIDVDAADRWGNRAESALKLAMTACSITKAGKVGANVMWGTMAGKAPGVERGLNAVGQAAHWVGNTANGRASAGMDLLEFVGNAQLVLSLPADAEQLVTGVEDGMWKKIASKPGELTIADIAGGTAKLDKILGPSPLGPLAQASKVISYLCDKNDEDLELPAKAESKSDADEPVNESTSIAVSASVKDTETGDGANKQAGDEKPATSGDWDLVYRCVMFCDEREQNRRALQVKNAGSE